MRIRLITLAVLVPLGAVGGVASALASSLADGVKVSQIRAMGFVPIRHMISPEKTNNNSTIVIKPRKSAKTTYFPRAGREGVPLQKLVQAPPTTIVDLKRAANDLSPDLPLLLGRANPSGMAKTSNNIAKTLPRTPKYTLKTSSTSQASVPSTLYPDVPGPALSFIEAPKAPVDQRSGSKKDGLLQGQSVDAGALLRPENQVVAIVRDGDGFRVSPRSLVFQKVGQTAKIIWPYEGSDVSLFIRDQNVVSLNRLEGVLTASNRGVTELYVVSQGKMTILPLTVEDGASQWELKIPDALVNLNGVFHNETFANLEHASFKGAHVDAGNTILSLRDSVAQTERFLTRESQKSSSVILDNELVRYGFLSLQILDERSTPTNGKLYPAPDVSVSVVGTEVKALTDATGHVQIRDVPQGSRVVVRLDDPHGALKSSLMEVEANTSVVRVRMLRSMVFDAMLAFLQTAQNGNLGSYCGEVTSSDGKSVALEGVRASLDVSYEGPIYFNRYGFPDRSLNGTGPDGRFCFLNVTPGPAALALVYGEGEVGSAIVPIFQGHHFEGDHVIGREKVFRTRLFAMASAHEQLNGDPTSNLRYSPIDGADLIPLGASEPMERLASGIVQSTDPVFSFQNKVRTLVRAAEFEPAVYQYRLPKQVTPITPLIPRGFVEDLAIYAQVSHDPEQGAVLVEYGHPRDLDTSVNVRLLDQYGRDVGEGWYFSDQPFTKALFFNVNPGIYTVIVETKDRYWLAADSVYVYNETISYLNLGAELRVHTLRKREDHEH